MQRWYRSYLFVVEPISVDVRKEVVALVPVRNVD